MAVGWNEATRQDGWVVNVPLLLAVCCGWTCFLSQRADDSRRLAARTAVLDWLWSTRLAQVKSHDLSFTEACILLYFLPFFHVGDYLFIYYFFIILFFLDWWLFSSVETITIITYWWRPSGSWVGLKWTLLNLQRFSRAGASSLTAPSPAFCCSHWAPRRSPADRKVCPVWGYVWRTFRTSRNKMKFLWACEC